MNKRDKKGQKWTKTAKNSIKYTKSSNKMVIIIDKISENNYKKLQNSLKTLKKYSSYSKIKLKIVRQIINCAQRCAFIFVRKLDKPDRSKYYYDGVVHNNVKKYIVWEPLYE